MSAEPFYHDGQYVGTLTQADDGSYVVVSDDGQVLAAADANNQPVDPALYAVEGNEPDANSQAPANLPETFDEPEPEDPQRVADPLEEAIDAQLSAAAMALEHRLGRSLTNAERNGVTDILIASMENDQPLEPFTALDVHHELAGTTPPNLDDPDERNRYMAERLEDLDRDTSPPAEIDTEPTDTSDMSLDELNAHMARQVEGHAPLADGTFLNSDDG